MKATPQLTRRLPTLLLIPAMVAAPVRAESVVPPEVCVDGEAVQVLNYSELPLEDARARDLARQAGVAQEKARLVTLAGLGIGVGFFALGLLGAVGGAADAPQATQNVGEDLTDLVTSGEQSQGRWGVVLGGVSVGGIGIGIGVGGVWLGRRGLSSAHDRADLALRREEEATGRPVGWRGEEITCTAD